jgi:hypothetical protein
MISGKTHTLDIACTEEQLARWQAGVKIQDAMPNVSAPLREFVKSGITPSEWTAMFGRLPRALKQSHRKADYGKAPT